MIHSIESLIQAVKNHATQNYENGGWDYVIECYEDSDIAEEITSAKATTPAAAISAVGKIVGIRDDYRKDIQTTAW